MPAKKIKPSTYGALGVTTLLFLWISLLLVAIIFLVRVTLRNDAKLSPCSPDGSFSLYSEGYNYWGRSSFFQISLGFGAFSFSKAKALDVSWDIVLGRVFQAFMAYFAWKAFTAYVSGSMQTEPVTFKTFQTVFLVKQPEAISILQLIKESYSRRGLPSHIAMVSMVISMLFILAFPTLSSAMTGYQQNVEPMVRDKNGDYTSLYNLYPTMFIIHDGRRVNLTKNYPVRIRIDFNWLPFSPNSAGCQRDFETALDVYLTSEAYWEKFNSWAIYEDPVRIAERAVYKYVKMYGYNGMGRGPTVYNTFELEGSPLNVSATYYTAKCFRSIEGNLYSDLNQMRWVKKEKKEVQAIGQGSFNPTLRDDIGGDTFDYKWMKSHISCKPTNTYRWGFSFPQLFTMLINLIIWSLGSYLMWLKGILTLEERGSSDIAGEFKATAHLASALQCQLEEDPLTLTEREICRRVKRDLDGGAIANGPPFSKNRFGLANAVWRWLGRKANGIMSNGSTDSADPAAV